MQSEKSVLMVKSAVTTGWRGEQGFTVLMYSMCLLHCVQCLPWLWWFQPDCVTPPSAGAGRCDTSLQGRAAGACPPGCVMTCHTSLHPSDGDHPWCWACRGRWWWWEPEKHPGWSVARPAGGVNHRPQESGCPLTSPSLLLVLSFSKPQTGSQ